MSVFAVLPKVNPVCHENTRTTLAAAAVVEALDVPLVPVQSECGMDR